jgi:hypothetical protein
MFSLTVISRGHHVPPCGNGFLDWVWACLAPREASLLLTHGLDAVMMIRTMKTFCLIFGTTLLLSFCVLIPVHATGSNKDLFKNDTNYVVTIPNN